MSGATSGASGSPASSPAKYQVATGADKLILQIAGEGGLINPSFQLTVTPLLALYGDGRVIVRGPTSQVSPGPLLPNLRQKHVTGAEIQEIMAAADSAGRLGPTVSYDSGGVMDAGTTTFRTTVGGITHLVSAGALGAGDGTMVSPDSAARAKLLHFENSMNDLSRMLGRTVADDGAYQPAGFDVFSSEAAQPDATQPVVTWPLASDPGTAGSTTLVDGVRCLAVKGADLAAFVGVAQTAPLGTIWKAPSGEYNVSVRPLYPEESGCAAVAG
jgi:hypothetical protein